MKTYKNLYPRIYNFENLEVAFRKTRRGKRSRPNVAAFEFNLDQELLGLLTTQSAAALIGSMVVGRVLPKLRWLGEDKAAG